MRTLILMATALLFAPAAEDGPLRSGVSGKELDKFGTHVTNFFTGLEEDNRRDQKEALDGLREDLAKSFKKAKVDADPLTFVGDWDVILERAKPNERTLTREAGKGFKLRTFEDPYDQKPVSYLLSLPSDYGKGDALHPTLLVLREPLGLTGGDLETAVMERAEALYGHLTDEAIVLIPIGWTQGEGRRAQATEIEGSWLTQDGLYALFTTMRVLLEEVRYDRSRLVVDGWGEGGADALRLASRAPYWFAGVINRSGSVGPDGDVLYANLANTPVAYVNGATEAVGADLGPLNAMGATVIEEAGSAYAPSDESHAALDEWFTARQREVVPTELDFRIDDIIYQSCYWLKAARINRRATATPADADFPRIKASIDRSANKVSIETTSVYDGVWIYLSDAMLDMDQPVVIDVNGKERHNKVVRRSLQDMLENRFYNNSGDCGIYTGLVYIEGLE
jgi:hypothetical protein